MSDDNNYDEFKQLGRIVFMYMWFSVLFSFLVKDNLFSSEDGILLCMGYCSRISLLYYSFLI